MQHLRYDILPSTNTFLMEKLRDESENFAYIEFTVDRSVRLLAVVSSTDRGNTTRFALTDSSGNIITERADRTQVEGVGGTTLVYELTPGTYRFVCNETARVGRVMSMEIVAN